jgi:hypothetical protein
MKEEGTSESHWKEAENNNKKSDESNLGLGSLNSAVN